MHQSQRAREGWLAVSPCVPNGGTVMDFPIDYASSHLARNCIRVKESRVSDQNAQSLFIYHKKKNLNVERERLYQVRGIIVTAAMKTKIITPHFTLLWFIFKLIWLLLPRRFYLFSAFFRRLDLSKMASCAPAHARIHYDGKIRTSLSMLQTTWCLWLSYW